ncbi:DUF551 domain-containing protein [Acinetobacter sp. YH12200]|uniref:DUF551 domain-containing protein n=1 Tax=Acinetobacter sp. YH12200 TaxID=2601139 RepID=UPI00211E6F3C|nr:DUF551 domain-containing protein [Acinetobacter sp. YH12200]
MDIQEIQEKFEDLLLANPDFDESLLEKDEESCYSDSDIQHMYSIFEAGTEVGEQWKAAKAQAVPEWISTSERMPEEGEEVLVHNLGQVRQVTRDSKWAGGFKERNCYGWQAAYSQSHWMPKSIELPEQYHFYYENDAKQKAMIEAQEPVND